MDRVTAQVCSVDGLPYAVFQNTIDVEGYLYHGRAAVFELRPALGGVSTNKESRDVSDLTSLPPAQELHGGEPLSERLDKLAFRTAGFLSVQIRRRVDSYLESIQAGAKDPGKKPDRG